MGVAAGRDMLEAEAERQQEGHKHSCSDMRTSGDVNSADAANAMQTSKDGKSSVTQPRKRHVSQNILPCIAITCQCQCNKVTMCKALWSLCCWTESSHCPLPHL